MGHALGRLQQHQALLGLRPVETATRKIIDQRPVVVEGVITPQRQLEALFALLGTVAGAGIAANLADRRNDFPDKADRVIGHVLDLNRDIDRLFPDGDLDRGCAHLAGHNKSIGIDRHQVVSSRELDIGCQIELASVRRGPTDDQASAVSLSRKHQPWWSDNQLIDNRRDRLLASRSLAGLLGRNRRSRQQNESQQGSGETSDQSKTDVGCQHGSSSRVMEPSVWWKPIPTKGMCVVFWKPYFVVAATAGVTLTGTNALTSLPVLAS